MRQFRDLSKNYFFLDNSFLLKYANATAIKTITTKSNKNKFIENLFSLSDTVLATEVVEDGLIFSIDAADVPTIAKPENPGEEAL